MLLTCSITSGKMGGKEFGFIEGLSEWVYQLKMRMCVQGGYEMVYGFGDNVVSWNGVTQEDCGFRLVTYGMELILSLRQVKDELEEVGFVGHG